MDFLAYQHDRRSVACYGTLSSLGSVVIQFFSPKTLGLVHLHHHLPLVTIIGMAFYPNYTRLYIHTQQPSQCMCVHFPLSLVAESAFTSYFFLGLVWYEVILPGVSMPSNGQQERWRRPALIVFFCCCLVWYFGFGQPFECDDKIDTFGMACMHVCVCVNRHSDTYRPRASPEDASRHRVA